MKNQDEVVVLAVPHAQHDGLLGVMSDSFRRIELFHLLIESRRET